MTSDWMSVDLRDLARRGPVHFMGVAGAGMSALAEFIVRSGGSVTGCDLRPGAAGTTLGALGAVVQAGHDPDHVRDAVALIMTSAVSPTHPEVVAARARGIPVLKRAQALGALVNRGTVLAVAGTHGKTTTTAATTAILDAAQLDPTGIVGGRMAAWGGGLRAGRGAIFVVEADEYDRSFLTLRPSAAVVTSVEADHLDIYGDLSGVESAFGEFLTQVRNDGLVAVCADDDGARRVGAHAAQSRNVLTYGTSSSARLRAVDVHQEGRTMTFTVLDGVDELGSITLGAPGMHNVRNALGAIALARHAGAPFAAAQAALPLFTGVSRRFQVIGTPRGVTIVDDYAHHPTEIDATIAAARGAFPQQRIVAAFQPHLYTRTRDLSTEFGRALAGADIVWVTDVYPAREAPIEGVTGEMIVAAAQDAGARDVRYAPSLAELGRGLMESLEGGDVLLAMGAGDIDEVAHGMLVTLDAEAKA